MTYASISDVTTLGRALNSSETARATALLEVISSELQARAQEQGKDLDEMIAEQPTLANVVKSVVVDVLLRTLATSTTDEPMSQMSQSALGYSVSGTYLVPGGGVFIKKNELKRIGLYRQKLGTIDLC